MDRVALRSWLCADPDRDPRVQRGFAAPIGFAVTLTMAAVLSALRPHLSADVALAVMAGVVALSGWWAAWDAVLAAAGFAWLMLNGFVADQLGELRWHGSSDVVRMVVLFGCGVAVTAMRSVQLRRRRRQRTGGQLDRELRELTRAARRTQGDRHA
jgi:hypothetical protein